MRNERFGQAGNGDNVPGEAFFDRCSFQPAERQNLSHASDFDQRAVSVEHLGSLIWFHAARENAASDDSAKVGIGFENCSQHPERAVLDLGRRHVANDQLEQRGHAAILRTFRLVGHPALLGRAVEDREIELFLGRIKGGKQIENFVGDLGGASVGPIDLIDDHDRLEPHLQGFGDHKFCLRERSFGGVHQHQCAIHHIEDALDLAAEIGMAGRIDDIDSRTIPDQRRGFGEDGNAALALKIV